MRNYRKAKGNFIAEFPIALWILLMLLFLPMINLATVCLRSTFVYMAVHNAAIKAARTPSFQAEINSQASAAETATNIVTNALGSVGGTTSGGFSGVTVNSITINIVITNTTSDTISRQTLPLTTPADDENNTYQIEVVVNASVQPLITVPEVSSIPGVAHVPGLTQPMFITMADRQYVENVQGLVY